MENEVVNTVVAEPVVESTPVVVETVQTAVPAVVENTTQIAAPVIEAVAEKVEKTFLGLNGRQWSDVGIAAGIGLAGAGIAEGIRYMVVKKPITNAIKNAKKVLDYAKNGTDLNDQTQAQPEQAAVNQEIPVPQQTQTTPVTPQENK